MPNKLKRITSLLIICVFLFVSLSLSLTKPALASPVPSFTNIVSQAKKELSNLEQSEQVQQIEKQLSDINISKKVQKEVEQVRNAASSIELPQKMQKLKESISLTELLNQVSQFKKFVSHINLAKEVEKAKKAIKNIDVSGEFEYVKKILSDQNLVEEAKQYLTITPDTFCTAYYNAANNIDNSSWQLIQQGAISTFRLVWAMGAAASAGAGSLAGYAGIASAVSQLGLGGLTTTIAGMLGSSATGAAATSVVTSFVGGPLIMSMLVGGGTGAAGFGTYKASQVALNKLNDFASQYCKEPTS